MTDHRENCSVRRHALVSPPKTKSAFRSFRRAAEAEERNSPACACDRQSSAPTAPLPASRTEGGQRRTPIRIMQIDCPTEEGMIRKKLSAMPGVERLEFNLMQRVLTVTHEPRALDAILGAIRSLGFQPELSDAAGAGAEPAARESRSSAWLLGFSLLCAAGAEIAHWSGLPEWLVALTALTAVLSCGLKTYRKGWLALRSGNLNINALMSIALKGALLLRQWPEAAMVMALFTLAEKIEARSLDRARQAVAGLMSLAPDTASVLQEDGAWRETAVDAIGVGSTVRTSPGERIALDGEIIRGSTSVDQAPITGESLPIDKTEGDVVFAGTINLTGAVEYRVTAASGGTTLARIIHRVEEAQASRAPIQRFVDRFARVYTPLVLLLALTVALIPPLFAGGEWQQWIYRALVLLVIACPCALVISTQVTLVSGLTAAARHGILIKGGRYLELGHRLAWLALDKTGTITRGAPVQTDMDICADVPPERCRALAASLAGRSDHPVSRAVAAANESSPLAEVDAFSAVAGQGVQGTIGGAAFALGNVRMVRNLLGDCPAALRPRVEELERQGKTVVMLMDERRVLALFAVADTVKESSRAAIDDLHRLGVGTVMLSGDNQHTATAMAGQVGIDRALGEQLPDDKLAMIETLSRQGVVGMVGDGINDTPALARAHIGFAMGAMGTDSALETADVALMDDDLRKIPLFIRLSRKTRAVLIQNISLALGIKAVFLLLTLAGMGSLWMAVFADVGASLLVVGNGLRLLRAGDVSPAAGKVGAE